MTNHFVVRKMLLVQLLILACVLLIKPANAQELVNHLMVEQESVKVAVESRDVGCHNKKQIQIGKMFCAVVRITALKDAVIKDLKLESFDAQMPAHRHGMVTRPTIKAKNVGEYLIEGVKLHMSGDWVFHLKFLRGKSTSQVAIPLKL